MKKNQRIQNLDKKYVWHPFTQMMDWNSENPLVIEKGKGVYVWDTDGNRYIDGVSSLWVNIHGHQKREIDRAIIQQLNKIAHSTLLGLSNVPSIALAKELMQAVPRGLTKVFYSDNGSTAVEIALKMTYQYWKLMDPQSERKKFITFNEAYHGDTLGAVSVGGIELFHQKFRPLLFDVIKLPSPYYFCKKRKMAELIKLVESQVKKHRGEIIGIVMEPLIQAAAGMLIHPKGFLRRIRSLCDRYHILLIVDEVATGFGRTGRLFACQNENVTPDLMAAAKGITGGYLPLAVTFVKEKIYKAFLGKYEEFKTFFHGHTYTGNPLACAAALASLKLFRKERLISSLGQKIHLIREELKAFRTLKHVYEIRQCGMMIGIELADRKEPKKEYPLSYKIGIRVCQEARTQGVILRPLGNVIVVMPPLCIDSKEIKKLIKATYQAIQKVTEPGL